MYLLAEHIYIFHYIYIYIHIYIYHATLLPQFPDSLPIRLFYPSFTAGLLDNIECPSVKRCWRQVLACRPTLARLCEGVHRRRTLMSLSLPLQQCPAYLLRFISIAFEMRVSWLSSCFFVECCFQALFNIVCSILLPIPSSFLPVSFVSVYLVNPYSRIDTTAAWKNLRFISSDSPDY